MQSNHGTVWKGLQQAGKCTVISCMRVLFTTWSCGCTRSMYASSNMKRVVTTNVVMLVPLLCPLVACSQYINIMTWQRNSTSSAQHPLCHFFETSLPYFFNTSNMLLPKAMGWETKLANFLKNGGMLLCFRMCSPCLIKKEETSDWERYSCAVFGNLMDCLIAERINISRSGGRFVDRMPSRMRLYVRWKPSC